MPGTSFPLFISSLASDDGHKLAPEKPLPTPLATVDNDIPGLGFVEDLAASPGHASSIIDASRDDIPSKIGNILGRGTHTGEILLFEK